MDINQIDTTCSESPQSFVSSVLIEQTVPCDSCDDYKGCTMECIYYDRYVKLTTPKAREENFDVFIKLQKLVKSMVEL